MIRGTVIAILLLGTAREARAADKDPIRDKLLAARTAYDTEMGQYRKQIAEWFDSREAVSRTDGDKKLLDQVKAERKAFDEDGELPKSVPATLKQKPGVARKAMEAAYSEAVKAYTKAKDDDKAAGVEGAWKAFVAEHTIDLLALTDPKAHAVAGGWKKDGTALVNESGDKTLQLPYEPGSEYDVELICRRVTGKECIAIGLIAGGRQTYALIDGWPALGYRSGFHLLDNKHASVNTTSVKGQWLKTDQAGAILCSVRDGRIDVSINGKPVTAFKGDFTRLSVPEGNGGPNKKALFLLVGGGTSFRIDQLVVTPVNGRGTVLK